MCNREDYRHQSLVPAIDKARLVDLFHEVTEQREIVHWLILFLFAAMFALRFGHGQCVAAG